MGYYGFNLLTCLQNIKRVKYITGFNLSIRELLEIKCLLQERMFYLKKTTKPLIIILWLLYTSGSIKSRLLRL